MAETVLPSTPLMPNRALLRVAAIALAGFLVGWLGRSLLAAPSDVPTTSIYKDWQVSCPAASDKTESCSVRQDVLNSRTGARLLRLLALHTPEGNILALTVPYDVSLQAGIAIGLDDQKPRVYAFSTCNTVGCIARIPFDSDLQRAIGAATNARVLVAGLDGKAVGIPFSIKGYNDAMRAFAHAQANRNSWFRRLWQ